MRHFDAIDGSFGFAGAGPTFEHDHDRRRQITAVHRGTYPFDEARRCTGAVAPPSVRPGPDHVGGIDDQHPSSIASADKLSPIRLHTRIGVDVTGIG